jgi:hypothetical protein
MKLQQNSMLTTSNKGSFSLFTSYNPREKESTFIALTTNSVVKL